MIVATSTHDLEAAANLIARSIWVCGCGRSGTSILTSLISSHQNIELSFDPPIVHWLLGLANYIDESALLKLIQIYIYRDSFRGALGSRNLNFNETDQSSVFNFKTKEEIKFRQAHAVHEWLNARREMDYRVCIKVTDATFRLSKLIECLRGMAFIGIVRDPIATVRSIHQKRWFARDRVNPSIESETLPLYLHPTAGPVPLWLGENDLDFWLGASDLERAALYCIHASNALLSCRDKVSLISYDFFVKNPKYCATELQRHFQIRPTVFTEKVLNSVSLRQSQDKTMIFDSLRKPTIDAIEELTCSISGISLKLSCQ